jgi:hypothetical protein
MADTTDVKLLPLEVRVEGIHTVTAQAMDFCVDSPDRHKDHNIPQRRALVHDFNDGLTINWAGDYPGGVTIDGFVVKVLGVLEVGGLVFPEKQTGGATKPANIADVIFSMQQEIATLKQELAALKQ